MTLLAFHNDPLLKQKYLDRVKAHAEADEIIKGYYWNEGRGCAVGCTIHSSEHKDYETELGIPKGLAYLQDYLFEFLPIEKAKKFPIQFLEVIKPGADLSLISREFHFWLLTNVVCLNRDLYPKVAVIVDQIIQLCDQQIKGKPPTDVDWSTAQSAARSAAISTACSTAVSEAVSAACSTAVSEAVSAAYSTVWSATESATWSATRSAARLAAVSAAWSAVELAAYSAAWSAAMTATVSAAYSAAWSAVELAAVSAAELEAESEAYSVVQLADWSGTQSIVWSAAQVAAIERISEKLLELLASA